MSSQYGELRPTAAEIGPVVWGTPASFNGFRVLAALLQRRRSTEANHTLHDVSPSPGLVHYIHFRWLLPRYRILPGAKFTLRPPSLALSYWQRYCTALEQWARDKLCAVEHRAPPISAGRPSRWASAHILVHKILLLLCPLLQFQSTRLQL